MVEELPKWQHFKDSSDFVLIFACLIPTLTLVRSSAMTMPSVIQTQKRLGALEPASSASGIQITSHALGGIINVGTFALVAVAFSAGRTPQSAQHREVLAAATRVVSL